LGLDAGDNVDGLDVLALAYGSSEKSLGNQVAATTLDPSVAKALSATDENPGDDLFISICTSNKVRSFEQFRAFIPASLPGRTGDTSAGVKFMPKAALSASAFVKSNPEEAPVQDFFGHDMLEANVPVDIVDMTKRPQTVVPGGPPVAVLGIDAATNRPENILAQGATGTGGPGTFTVPGANWGADRFAGCCLVDSGYEPFEVTGNSGNQLRLLSGTPRDGAWTLVKDPTFLEQIIVEFYEEYDEEDSTEYLFTLRQDLLPLDQDQEVSGVAIYRDNDRAAGNRNGVFDSDIDIPLQLDGPPLLIGEVGEPETQVKFVFSTPGTDDWPMPRNQQARRRQWVQPTFGVLETDADKGPDFFVVIRPSTRIDVGDDFRVGIVCWGPNTPTEPDPDTFASSSAAPDEFDIFAEYPWGARGLGFVSTFSEPQTQYYMDGPLVTKYDASGRNRIGSGPRAGRRVDTSGFNWVRTSSSKHRRTNAIRTEEEIFGPYSLRIEGVSQSVLPATIPPGQSVALVITGSGFGSRPTVVISGYAVTITSASSTAIHMTLANEAGSVPQDPIVVIIRNPDTGSERSRDDLFSVSSTALSPSPTITSIIPDRGTQAAFPVTIRGASFNAQPQVEVLFGETKMPIVSVADDGTSIVVDFPPSGFPVTGPLDVSVRNYTKVDLSTYTEDTKLGGFTYQNLPSRETPRGCFGAIGSVKGGLPPGSGSGGGDALVVALAALALLGASVRKGGFFTVQLRLRRAMPLVLALFLVLGMTSRAYAFFPIGGYGLYDLKLKYALWPFQYMDVNGDGDVSGDNEGVEFTIESGQNGFTSEEIEIVKEAFKVWEDVPTSYIKFRFTNNVSDPFDFSTSGGGELINFVAMDVEDDVYSIGVGDLVLGVTLLTYVIDDTIFPIDITVEPLPGAKQDVDVGEVGFPVSGGQIIKADIIIAGDLHRTLVPGQDPLADLKSTLVHEIGHVCSLGHTPLNNLELFEQGGVLDDVPLLVESPVIAMRDSTNTLQRVGVTPTMWPVYFYVDDGTDNLIGGWQDLAPDDVAGVSFLYPRGSQEDWFTLTHWARTQTREDFPSVPIGGGHVVAWADTDSDPTTSRVPLISTMTGLYDPELQIYYKGRFFLRGLPKEIEAIGGLPKFPATYTLTLNPLNGYDISRMAPDGLAPEDFNSIEGNNTDYNTLFISEVFHETGNLLDMANKNVGTPVKYDGSTGQIVSVDTGKTLSQMLTGQMPMFGDELQMCPLNVILAGVTGERLSDGLRGFRDGVLVHTALGAALVDAYYQAAPETAAFLLRHSRLLEAARVCVAMTNAAVVHSGVLAMALAAIVILGVALRWRRARAAAALILVALALGWAPAASASVIYVTTEQLEEASDPIITGKVTEVNSHWIVGDGTRIVTDVTIETDDVVKGAINKSTLIQVRIPGGCVGSIVTKAVGMPTFKENEEVLVYLQYRDEVGYLVVAGARGKFDIVTDSTTGEKYVAGIDVETQTALREDAAKIDAGKGGEAAPAGSSSGRRIALREYKKYLRDLARTRERDGR